MNPIQWQKWFEVGHETIDLEHQTFFFLVKKLEQLVHSHAPPEQVRRTISEVLKYADFHFTSEENVMMEVDYADLERHRAEHRKLLFRLREDATGFDGGEVAGHHMVEFLYRWLLKHTIEEDAHLAMVIKRANLDALFQR